MYNWRFSFTVNQIGKLADAEKHNDGQGSLLYVWSGATNSYPVLPATTYVCSVETDCNDTISIISLDFRFSENDQNLTCIDENKFTITDDSISQNFNCSTSNNEFEIKTLYTSTSNYITLQYTGTTAGGYLWLGFQCKLILKLVEIFPQKLFKYTSTYKWDNLISFS